MIQMPAREGSQNMRGEYKKSFRVKSEDMFQIPTLFIFAYDAETPVTTADPWAPLPIMELSLDPARQ
jgi:hypothetical protein